MQNAAVRRLIRAGVWASLPSTRQRGVPLATAAEHGPMPSGRAARSAAKSA